MSRIEELLKALPERGPHGRYVGPHEIEGLEMTGAAFPSEKALVKIEPGYKVEVAKNCYQVPLLITANVHRSLIMDVLEDLIDQLGNDLEVILETSHDLPVGSYEDLYVPYCLEPLVVKSYLRQYEDLLLNDGGTGIAVLNSSTGFQVQLNEDKKVVVYVVNREDLEKAKMILESYEIPQRPMLVTVGEVEHYRNLDPAYARQFIEFAYNIGAEKEDRGMGDGEIDFTPC